MLQLTHNELRIAISNDSTCSLESVDNHRSYQHEYKLGGAEHISSRHSVLVVDYCEHEISSCLLLAGGGASGIHEHSAVIHDNQFLIAVGPYLAALGLPDLELKWFTEVDSATCFGVYHSEKHRCFITHGELEVARISYTGQIEWQCGGADIFTNGFRLFDDCVEVVDWNNDLYRVDLRTGQSTR